MSLLQTADMERILAELSRERPVFHSEADFQLAFALKMQQLYPQIAIRLERTEIVDNKRLRIDVVAHQDGQTTLMELKYPTQELCVQVHLAEDEYETYNLRNQAKLPPRRYDLGRSRLWSDTGVKDTTLSDMQYCLPTTQRFGRNHPKKR
jgi:hypothetical protein